MAKKAITYILNEGTLKSLVNHPDLDALNRSYWYHHDRVKDVLTKTEKEIFFLINKYSVKYRGVSYMSHRTIATQLNCSTKTVQRAYRKLEKLGVIEAFEAKRTSDMKQTSSIVRIIRHEPEQTELPDTNVQQGTGENVQPETPSPKHPCLRTNTFEGTSVSRAELAVSFNIPQETIHATLPLVLSDAKFVELFARNGKGLYQKVFREALKLGDKYFLAAFRVWNKEWEMQTDTLRQCLHSASVRTNHMAKTKRISNVVGYFLNTFWNLYEPELRETVKFFDEESPGWHEGGLTDVG